MEKEKTVLEKSSSFSSKNEETRVPETAGASDSPKVVVEPKTDSPKVETKPKETEAEIKEEKTEDKVDKSEENQHIKENQVEEIAPPEIQYTLETVSEEIDKFISGLSAKKEKDDENVTLEMTDFVWKFLDLFEEKIAEHDHEGKAKWGKVPEEDKSFAEALDRVSKLTESLNELKKDNPDQHHHSVLINRIGGIHHRAMSYLGDEFRSMLEESKTTSQDHLDPKCDAKADVKGKQEASADQSPLPESESFDEPADVFPGYSSEVVSNLNQIAKEMISGGYEFECGEIYMTARRQAFDESLSHLGFEKISIDDVQKMQWEALEREIATWIKTFRLCTTVYFPGERKLGEAVFSAQTDISASLFSNLTRGVMIQFLNFAEALAMTKRSAEKLFKFLDLYEALRDSLPALGELFSEECARELKTEATTAKSRLGETAISIFGDLENSIKSEMGKNTVPGGAVHPLTRYTMNYLKYVCEYKDTLEQVFKDHSKIERHDSTSRPRNYEGEEQNYNNSNQDDSQSPFTIQLVRVMDLLDSNLEAKSKLYRDVSLSSIFMMNNGRYILQKIKGSAEIHDAMGDTWCRKKSSDLRNYHKNYQRETWSRLLGCLVLEGLMVNGKVLKPVLKERFKSFNAMFDDIHKTQSSWVVSDDQLQSELRVSISAVVTPAYRSFVGRFSQYLDPGRQTEKYIKYQPEDIENYIDELFDGKRKP
ncbi:hypothetical protein ACOSP7_002036 [Xanthoceras sorbifolium]|uniref:Exocyst subunit Exo70 family protein n=1 Tax=Xanthoceras sorbifolium TaxID=99658 RepID=A0ABQ8IKD7_9ROSI|nr:hypothetical protein JRO89_XS01G0214600 [Xanthoceras sorbifolium]